MDIETLRAYDADAARYADAWTTQPAPDDLYALLTERFLPGPTVDIGCGAGRDVAWLGANGFAPASGFDASEGLLAEARERHPGYDFGCAALPALEGVPRGLYTNVLCETVIMHLDPADVGAATRSLLDLLQRDGTLSLGWRVTDGQSLRDGEGRLYAAFDKQAVLDALPDTAIVLVDQEESSRSSGMTVHRLIVRKAA
jgi:SAM-dependent methyltransferase